MRAVYVCLCCVVFEALAEAKGALFGQRQTWVERCRLVKGVENRGLIKKENESEKERERGEGEGRTSVQIGVGRRHGGTHGAGDSEEGLRVRWVRPRASARCFIQWRAPPQVRALLGGKQRGGAEGG